MIGALRAFGPAIPRPKAREALRAAFGAGLGLLLTGGLLYLISPTASLLHHPLLVAPFAASAVLIFAVPNSPLAQPWAVVVGNSIAALIGLGTIHLLPMALPAGAIAVLITLLATAALRATHPPAGAAAMATVLAYHADAPTSLAFALHPVLTGSVLLVVAGMVWNRATGRVYPFRQSAPAPHGTSDTLPERRLSPSPDILAATLDRLRLGANVGVEDLARLIDAAEAESAGAALGQITAKDIMSHDLVTCAPDTTLHELAASFRLHRFKSLPIRDDAGHYAGCVIIDALVGLSDPHLTAHDLRDPSIHPAAPETPLAELIALLSDGHQQTVPIVAGHRLVGLITRSDLIALLIHHHSLR